MDAVVKKEGYLQKRGEKSATFRQRYAVLSQQQHSLKYGKTKAEAENKPINQLSLEGSSVEKLPETEYKLPFCFKLLTLKQGSYVFQAASESELEDWIRCLRKAMLQARRRRSNQTASFKMQSPSTSFLASSPPSQNTGVFGANRSFTDSDERPQNADAKKPVIPKYDFAFDDPKGHSDLPKPNGKLASEQSHGKMNTAVSSVVATPLKEPGSIKMHVSSFTASSKPETNGDENHYYALRAHDDEDGQTQEEESKSLCTRMDLWCREPTGCIIS
eukprot:GILK01006768.1.p1 GENE.GILK01006768.1~~GILK01006768.1.p1  ORF type:complete len:274 (-),score=23.61 GILK01006768.1:105-926(-)